MKREAVQLLEVILLDAHHLLDPDWFTVGIAFDILDIVKQLPHQQTNNSENLLRHWNIELEPWVHETLKS